MSKLETTPQIDWTQCELIESVPGKVSGRPVVRGTRIMPDPIVNSYDLGDSIEEIQEGFPTLSIDQIERLINSLTRNDAGSESPSGRKPRPSSQKALGFPRRIYSQPHGLGRT